MRLQTEEALQYNTESMSDIASEVKETRTVSELESEESIISTMTSAVAESDNTTKQELETESKTDAETSAESEAASNTETDNQIETSTETETNTTVETSDETSTESEIESTTELEAETNTELDTETTTETQSESSSIIETETQSDSSTPIETETQSDSSTPIETETETQTELQTETETETETESKTENETETELETETLTEPESKSHLTKDQIKEIEERLKDELNQKMESDGFVFSGYMDSGMEAQPLEQVQEASLFSIRDSLPDRYSAVEDNQDTAIKDQGDWGACWSFAAIAPAESIYKKQTGKEVNLSEPHLINFFYNENIEGPDGG